MNETVVQLEGVYEGEYEDEKEGEHGKDLTGLDEERSRPGLARELVWPADSHWFPLSMALQCRDSPLDHYNAIRCHFPSPRPHLSPSHPPPPKHVSTLP